MTPWLDKITFAKDFDEIKKSQISEILESIKNVPLYCTHGGVCNGFKYLMTHYCVIRVFFK